MSRRRNPPLAAPELDEISRRMMALVHERMGPDASLDELEGVLLAIREEVVAEVRRAGLPPESPEAPVPPRPAAGPRRR